MDGTSVEPVAQSVAASTTNQMEGIEGEEQSAPRNIDSTKQPTPLNQNPSEGATDKDQMEEEVIIKRKRKKTSKIWDHYSFMIMLVFDILVNVVLCWFLILVQ